MQEQTCKLLRDRSNKLKKAHLYEDEDSLRVHTERRKALEEIATEKRNLDQAQRELEEDKIATEKAKQYSNAVANEAEKAKQELDEFAKELEREKQDFEREREAGFGEKKAGL